jgi:hypothetical protein
VVSAQSSAQPAERNVGGRPARLADYVGALIDVIRPIYLGDAKPPKRQADIEHSLKNYFALKRLKVSKTSIRDELARPLFKALKSWEDEN